MTVLVDMIKNKDNTKNINTWGHNLKEVQNI